MKKAITIFISFYICTLSSTIFAWIVYDPTVFAQTLKNGIVETQTLSTAGKQLTTANNYLDIAKTNSKKLGQYNWGDVRSKLDSVNKASCIGRNLSYASNGAARDFENLFTGGNMSQDNYVKQMTDRSNTVLNTLQGSVQSAITSGDQICDAVDIINKMRGATSGVGGQLQAMEESNQIEGELLNQVQQEKQLQLQAMSNQAAYQAYMVQKKQDEVNSTKTFLHSADRPFHEYEDSGAGIIPNFNS